MFEHTGMWIVSVGAAERSHSDGIPIEHCYRQAMVAPHMKVYGCYETTRHYIQLCSCWPY